MPRLIWALVAMLVSLYASPGYSCVGKTLHLGIVDSPSEQLLAEIVSQLITQRTGTTVKVDVYKDSQQLYKAVRQGDVGLLIENTDRALEVAGKRKEATAKAHALLYAALLAALGPRARGIPVSSSKSMIGHLLGGAGAVEGILTVLALATGWLPPNVNYETPDPQCDLRIVRAATRAERLRVAVSNSFGFGGANAVLVFRAVGADS